jgi:hypothetical protein
VQYFLIDKRRVRMSRKQLPQDTQITYDRPSDYRAHKTKTRRKRKQAFRRGDHCGGLCVLLAVWRGAHIQKRGHPLALNDRSAVVKAAANRSRTLDRSLPTSSSSTWKRMVSAVLFLEVSGGRRDKKYFTTSLQEALGEGCVIGRTHVLGADYAQQ